MPLVFAAITPHPPILIPNIGKENLQKIDQTKKSFEKLEQDLYSSKPDVIFIISPHGELDHSAFTINLCQKFDVNFESFGDFTTKMTIPGDMITFTAAKESLGSKAPINIISEPNLDHGSSIPLFYLVKHMPETPIVPIYFSMLDYQAHFEFGKALKDLILNNDKRIAVIASGDLSHCLTSDAPAPFNADGQKFDEKIMDIILSADFPALVNLDPKLIENASECGLRSILILAGILSDISCKPEILSYEGPYGVGYMTVEVIL